MAKGVKQAIQEEGKKVVLVQGEGQGARVQGLCRVRMRGFARSGRALCRMRKGTLQGEDKETKLCKHDWHKQGEERDN